MYEKNLVALKTFHPEVAEQIDRVSGLKINILFNDSIPPNLYIENDKGVLQPCYSEENPLADLDNFVSILNEKKGYANCVLGAGLCIHIQAILDKLDKDIYVILFEAYPEIIKRAMSIIDLTKVFSHPQIRIVSGDSFDIPELFSDENAKLYSSRGYNYIEFNKITALGPLWYEDVKKRVKQFFIKREKSKKVIEEAGNILFANRFKNLFAMNESNPVDVLKNRNQNVPAIIVASGPSLENNIDEIKNAANAVIIAADSAVAPLKMRGITPDYIVATDFRDLTYEKLASFSEDLSDSRLVFFSEVTPKIPAYINFMEKFYIFLNPESSELFGDILGIRSKAMPDAQSVLHGAIHVAQIMGCTPVVFTGVDLAFSGEKDHAEGTVLNWGNNQTTDDGMIMVEAFDGSLIPSIPGFIAQKEICERLIEKRHDIKYIDASEGGIKIEGTEITPLAEVIVEYCSQKNKAGGAFEAIDVTCLSPIQVLKSLKNISKGIREINKKLKVYFEANNKIKRFFKANKHIRSIDRIPEKIKQNIQKMDSINVSLNENTIIKSIKELTGKSYSEYLEHTFEEVDISASSKIIKQLLLDIRQQGFVQTIRLDSISEFSEIVNEQINFFSELYQIENNDELDGSIKKMRLAECFYRYEMIGKAENLFKESAGLPEADFYSGFINIKKGQVEKGKKQIAKAVAGNNALQKEAEKFTGKIIEHYFAINSENIYKDIIIDRILRIDPENKRAYEILKENCMNKADSFLAVKKILEAEQILSKLWEPGIVHNIKYLMLFLMVSLHLGKYDRIRILLETAKLADDETGDYIYWCRYWLNKYQYLGTEWVDRGGLTTYVSWLDNDDALTTLLQIIWGTVWHKAEDRLKKFQRNSSFLNKVDSGLEKWAAIRDIIPEWYLVRALNLMARGDNDGALQSCDYAINVSRDKKSFFISPVEVIFVKAWNYCEMKQYSKALPLIERCIEFSVRVNWWLIWLQLKIKNDSNINLNQKIEGMNTINFFKPHLAYYNGLEWLKEEGILEPLISEIIIACDCPVRGEQLIFAYWKSKEELRPENVQLIRNIVFDIRLRLSRDGTPLINHLIYKEWTDDVAGTRDDSTPEDRTEIFDIWNDLSAFLLGWDLFHAELCVAGNENEKALQILDNAYETNQNRIDFLELYVIRLFYGGRSEDALRVFEELLFLSPDSVSILKKVGDNFLDLKQYSSALTIYEECLELMPEKFDVLLNIGEVYYQTGNNDAASLAYETLLVQEPENVQAKDRLAEINACRK